MNQLTLDDAERQWHINRLEHSMARWRVCGLDARLPEDYARYCGTLDHLKAGGAYVVRHFDPSTFFRAENYRDAKDVPPDIRDVIEGFAHAAIGGARAASRHNRKQAR